MAITQAAVREILNVMKRNGLEPSRFYLRLQRADKVYAISFVSDPGSDKVISFGELRLVLSPDVAQEKCVIDYGQMGEQKGLIFR